MIDEGQFSVKDVTLHLFKAASVQDGRFPIKRQPDMRCQREDCWVLVAEERAGVQTHAVGKYDLFMLHTHELIKLQWWSNPCQTRRAM
jgi:hypothetical protein